MPIMISMEPTVIILIKTYHKKPLIIILPTMKDWISHFAKLGVWTSILLSAQLSFTSCKSETSDQIKIETAKRLMTCIRNRDTACIDDLISSRDVRMIGKDNRIIFSECNKVISVCEKYGYPAPDKYILTVYPSPLIKGSIVKIPLFKGIDTAKNLREAYINVFFSPDKSISLERILSYELVWHLYNTNFKAIPSPYEKDFRELRSRKIAKSTFTAN